MHDDSMQIETPQEIITETDSLNKLSNATTTGFFDKKINYEICAVRFWKRKSNLNSEDYFTLASECTKDTRLLLLHFTFVYNIYLQTYC